MEPAACKILLPVDGSADALAAVRHALQHRGAAPGGYDFPSLVLGVVKSRAFHMRQAS